MRHWKLLFSLVVKGRGGTSRSKERMWKGVGKKGKQRFPSLHTETSELTGREEIIINESN